MTILVCDTESTIFQKGNPFAQRNRLCYVGFGTDKSLRTFNIMSDPCGLVRDTIREAMVQATDLLLFNAKFDLHWLRRAEIALNPRVRVWDCQLAHFILTGQKKPYPSLDEVAAHYGIPGKFTYIWDNYWSKGIDTPDIPEKEMLDYLEQDLRVTYAIYLLQLEEFKKNPKLYNLFRLDMQDTLVLAEMEWNGLKLNVEKAQQQEKEARERLTEIDKILMERCPNAPINWDSGDHVSAYLYGGTIVVDRKEVVGVYATGAKVGQPRHKWYEDKYELLRLVEPIEGSELAKADKEKGTGPWSTAEDVLKQVKQVPQVKLLLERAKLTKLLDYLSGFPSLILEKDWKFGELHGQYNQTVARTGRLSSSGPNLQNLPDQLLQLIESRYAL
jgi:DNA polymerase I-like protein with 3'-5' exonuclease and polymerase domains